MKSRVLATVNFNDHRGAGERLGLGLGAPSTYRITRLGLGRLAVEELRFDCLGAEAWYSVRDRTDIAAEALALLIEKKLDQNGGEE